VGNNKHWQTLDTAVSNAALVHHSIMFTTNYSPEQTRLVTPLHGVVSTWFEEQVAAHAAQIIDIDPFLA